MLDPSNQEQEHHWYPIFLNLKGRNCLVVGGGKIASGKITGLLKAGADVTCIAPDVTPEILVRSRLTGLDWEPRVFRESDLRDRFLVIAATADMELNAQIYKLADKQNIVTNAVDDVEHCNFILGAIAKAGPVQVVVSSSGTSPVLAGRLRDKIRQQYLDHEIGVLAGYLGARRKKVVLPEEHSEKRRFWEQVLDSEIPTLVASGRIDRADEVLAHLEAGMVEVLA